MTTSAFLSAAALLPALVNIGQAIAHPSRRRVTMFVASVLTFAAMLDHTASVIGLPGVVWTCALVINALVVAWAMRLRSLRPKSHGPSQGLGLPLSLIATAALMLNHPGLGAALPSGEHGSHSAALGLGLLSTALAFGAIAVCLSTCVTQVRSGCTRAAAFDSAAMATMLGLMTLGDVTA
ncbi:hypothetical protein [Herbiconiux daphne]|uniref:DUF5134 domain-containing protein n=1 Tax=Herbiconiux daphne TaxID=2970914 RepID=A0ABT2H6W5_9MICO|nr:hypothetical protein [Herbiconiux daphne]MCS5735682.1 hypothetical protein [Herbiconiux daphne]